MTIVIDTLAAATDYARRGWRVVILHDAGKRPRLNDWPAKATTDVVGLEKLLTRWPSSNIGILLGPSSGLVDVEHDGPEGQATADQLLVGITTPTYRSARSTHRLFRFPTRIALTSAVVKRQGVELRFGTNERGAQSVAPPSVHASGVRYEWLPGLSPDEAPLADFPQCLVDLMNSPSAGGNGATTFRMADETPIVERARRYIDRMPPAISGQGGHDQTFNVACELYRFGLTDDDAEILIGDYNQRCLPPWPEDDLAHKLRDARAKVLAAGEFGSRLNESRDTAGNGTPRAQHTRNGKQSLAETYEPSPIVTRADTVEQCDVTWLWQNRIPLGRVTLLVGKPGEGKSFVTLDLAARVTTGTPFPDGLPCTKGSVVLMSAEDDPSDTVVPRLDAHYADLSRVHLLTGMRCIDPDGKPFDALITLARCDVIASALETIDDCRLLVIDPIGSYLGSKTDAHRDNEVRAVLAPIAAMASRFGVAVLLVAHRRKSMGHGADESALGSRAFTGIARAVWHLSRDPQAKSRRLLLPGKNNLAAEGAGLAFTIIDDPPRVCWERDPVELSADDGLAAELQARRPGPDSEAQDDAAEWLRQALADGPRQAKDLRDEWTNGIGGAWRTLERAKSAAGAEAFRPTNPGPWWWQIPGRQADRQDPKGVELGGLGGLGKTPGKTHDFGPPDPQTAKLFELGGLGPDGPIGEWIP